MSSFSLHRVRVWVIVGDMYVYGPYNCRCPDDAYLFRNESYAYSWPAFASRRWLPRVKCWALVFSM